MTSKAGINIVIEYVNKDVFNMMGMHGCGRGGCALQTWPVWRAGSGVIACACWSSKAVCSLLGQHQCSRTHQQG